MINQCFNCDSVLSDRGLFCKSCKKQFKCKACNELLEPDTSFCIMCGEDIIPKKSEQVMNTIEFSESNGKRSFKASFTDIVGNSIGETFGAFLVNKAIQSSRPRGSSKSLENNFLISEYTEESEAEHNNSDLHLDWKAIFKQEGDKISLIQPTLKAKSKNDFLKRLICLFLQFKKDMGVETVPRNELTILMKQCSIEDGNSRATVGHEKSLFRSDSTGVELLLPGSEFVKEIKSEMMNSEIPNTWKIGTKGKSRKSKGKIDNDTE